MTFRLFTYLFLIVSFASCDTYKTFYKTTVNSTDSLTESANIYRFKVQTYQIDTAEEALTQLTKLRVLDLSGSTKNINVLNNLLDALPNPTNLQVLILDSLDLTVLPKAIKRFKNLKQLSLNNNPQLHLDQALRDVQHLPLKFLNLQHNQLTKLPASISNLNTLEDLNLSYNHLTDDNTFIYLSHLNQLKSLWLNYNDLTNLPNTISQLEQLSNLYFENNNIKKLPKDFYKMKKVWVIHAGHNEFTSLPEQFIKMKSLLLLHINNCKIAKIPQVYNAEKSPFFGLIMDNNNLSERDKATWRKRFRRFFVLSIE